MRQSEFKRRYDPVTGRIVREHIYGAGIWDSIKSVGSKIFGRTAKKAAAKAATKAVTKVSEHAGEKAEDKIIEFLHRKKTRPVQSTMAPEDPTISDSFFERLADELLPNLKDEINLVIESDGNLIWQAGAACRVIITKLQLIVPRLLFNSEGQKLYMNEYWDTRKWTYLRENIEASNSTQQRTGSFRISTEVSRPRHAFVFIINDANMNVQTANPFLCNTFSVSTDPCTLSSCYLEVGNGNEYPEQHYKPSTEPTRVYCDVLKFVHGNNEYSNGTQLNRTNFGSMFPFVYFDLTKQRLDIKDGTTKLTFKYELSGTTTTHYTINALNLYEQDVELRKTDGKIILRT